MLTYPEFENRQTGKQETNSKLEKSSYNNCDGQSVDWREKFRNRDKAKLLEDLKGYTIGKPD